jgi:phosphoadenosine phosphosulfate reductase
MQTTPATETRSSAPLLSAPRLNDAELDAISERLETWSASDIVGWTIETFGSRLCVAASMADTVLIDIATKVDPDIEIVFLDTGFHFPETLLTVRKAQQRYQLNLRVERAKPTVGDLFTLGTEGCCAARKVAVLDRVMAEKDAWLTGLRRAETEARANSPILSRDKRGVVKVCPIANWSNEAVTRYILENDVIVNPLQSQGYPSIGCWPCTSKVAEGDDPRSGRWAGSGKTECGLHL